MLVEERNVLSFKPVGGIMHVHLPVDDIKNILPKPNNTCEVYIEDKCYIYNGPVKELFNKPDEFTQDIIDGKLWTSSADVTVSLNELVHARDFEELKDILCRRIIKIDPRLGVGELQDYSVISATDNFNIIIRAHITYTSILGIESLSDEIKRLSSTMLPQPEMHAHDNPATVKQPTLSQLFRGKSKLFAERK